MFFKSGRFVAGLGIGVVCLVLVAATFAFAQTPAQPQAQAAPAAQVTPTQAPAKPQDSPTPEAKTPASASASDPTAYQSLFNKTLAAKLGVSEEALNSAFAAALTETTAQMVKDGQLDANAQAKLQGIFAKGPGGLVLLVGAGDKAGNGSATADPPATNPKILLQNAFPVIAPMLKLSADDLLARLQNGQSLHDLAVAANVDPQTLETALLNSFKTQLDDAVKAGKITQAEADAALKTAPSFVDGFINAVPSSADKTIKTLFDSDATWQAAAQALNLPVDTLRDRVKQGQSVLQIAEAQKVDPAKVREALQSSFESQVAAWVKSGQLTADQAANVTPALPKVVDGFLNEKTGTK